MNPIRWTTPARALLASALLTTTLWTLPLPAFAQSPTDGARSQEEAVTMETADKVTPSVVSIQVVVEMYDSGVKQRASGIGSGVIIDPEGHVLTNYHVAGRAKKMIVTMQNGEKIGATLVGADPYTDLAVIRLHLDELKTTNLTWASLGDSDNVQTGQSCLAVGSPQGLKQTVTKGIVSNSERYFSGEYRLPTGERTGEFNTWIQTDATMNGGNSGAPLVNNRGEIIGINSRGYRGADGLGFAVPINVAKDVLTQILENGEVTRSWIGVELQSTEDFEKFFGTDVGEGILVASVVQDSPADRAGLRTGDVMLAWNDAPTNARFTPEVPDVRRMLAESPPGQEVSMKVLRDGQQVALSVVPQKLEPEIGEEFECENWRCSVRGMTRFLALARKMESVLGVLVIGVDGVGPANDSKLRTGDVIVKLDGKPVVDLADFKTRYDAALDAEKPMVMLAVRRGKSMSLIVIENDYSED